MPKILSNIFCIATSFSHWKAFGFMNNSNTEYTAIKQFQESVFVLVLNATNGDLLTAKEFQYPSLTFNDNELHACGKISENQIIISTRDTGSHFVSIVNSDTWTADTYYAAGNNARLFSFTPIFSTDQIVLMLVGTTHDALHVTLQTAYDKLDKTEMYTK